MEKTFDAVAWMRRRRIEIDEEDQGFTWEEKRDQTLAVLREDPLWLRLQRRLVRPSSARSAGLPARRDGE